MAEAVKQTFVFFTYNRLLMIWAFALQVRPLPDALDLI
jgi:hypothetical protein